MFIHLANKKRSDSHKFMRKITSLLSQHNRPQSNHYYVLCKQPISFLSTNYTQKAHAFFNYFKYQSVKKHYISLNLINKLG